MAETLRVNVAVPGSSGRRVTLVRVAIIATILVGWEALAASGLLFRDVVPSLTAIGERVRASPPETGGMSASSSPSPARSSPTRAS